MLWNCPPLRLDLRRVKTFQAPPPTDVSGAIFGYPSMLRFYSWDVFSDDGRWVLDAAQDYDHFRGRFHPNSMGFAFASLPGKLRGPYGCSGCQKEVRKMSENAFLSGSLTAAGVYNTPTWSCALNDGGKKGETLALRLGLESPFHSSSLYVKFY